jgi:predicted PurR-regulated permease PerM
MRKSTTVETDAATPIWISRRTRQVLVVVGVGVAALILWRVTTLVSLLIGGAALAVALSFPVDGLSRVMPRRVAIAVTLFLIAAIAVLAITVFAPIIADQLGALVAAVPDVAQRLDERVPSVLDSLAARGLLPDSPESVFAEIQTRLLAAVQQFAQRLLGQLGPVVSGAAGVVVALAGILLVAVTLLANARRVQAGVLRAVPRRYRRDVRSLWNACGDTLSRYLGGLALSLLIEGVLAAIVFHQIGLPYALTLGAWVALTAVIPYVSAWLGYGPAVLLALTISPTKALITLALGVTVNAVVGNVITPRIQGQAVNVHPMFVFLAVVTGAELFGIPGVILAVPAMALLRVLYDFLRVRVRVVREGPANDATVSAAPPGPGRNGTIAVRRDIVPALGGHAARQQ